jgi:hypothetical protein
MAITFYVVNIKHIMNYEYMIMSLASLLRSS